MRVVGFGATPTLVKKWLGALLVVTALACLVFGGFFIVVRGMSHKYYEVEGTIRVSPPESIDVTLPAVACMSADRSQGYAPYAITRSGTVDGTAYVVCEIPQDGTSIPFKTSTYGNTGYGIQIRAFLQPIPWSHPSCADAATPAVLVSDEDRTLERICSHGELPPKSEIALAAPFDGGDSQATETIRIVVTRAE